MVEYVAVLDPAPLSPMQYSAHQKALAKILYWPFCHCFYVALKLCTSTLLYYQIKQRGVIKVYSNLDHVARTCMVCNCLPVLIHWSEYHAVGSIH